ncbi:MAG: hypothetical protein ACI4P4_13680 [Faecousia sp.]
MKKKVLCFFSLVLYLLIACTLLSGKIQEEMITQVEIGPVNTRAPHEQVTRELPGRMIFTDETGNHVYEVVDGTGWEDGPRIREEGSWSLSGDGVVSIPGYPDSRYVTSASRQPQPGERVEILGKPEWTDDRYLAIYDDGVPEGYPLPSGTEDMVQSEQAMLLTMTGVITPFMEHRAKTMSMITDHARHIFSLTDVEQFFAQLPNVTAVILTLAAGLVFWAHACCLSFRGEGGGWLTKQDVGIVAATLCLLPVLLRRFDFPASLLPEENILQWSHYREEFSLFFTAIADFPQAAREIAAARDEAISGCKKVFCAGALMIVFVLILESVALWIKDRFRKRDAAYTNI